jgi:hypothetical protein
MVEDRLRVPRMSRRSYAATELDEMGELCEELSEKNRKWFQKHAPSKRTHWMYVNSQGQIWGHGESNLVPCADDLKEASRLHGNNLFLLKLDQSQFRDRTYFFKAGNAQEAYDLLGIEEDEVMPFREDIVTVNAQSGLTSKLLKAGWALGELGRRVPLAWDKQSRHQYGATVVHITNIGPDYVGDLHMGSQNKAMVNLRGSKVTGQRKGDENRNVTRIERLHRFDCPILDIYDTFEDYARGLQIKVNPLVLHGERETFDPGMEEERNPMTESFKVELYVPGRKESPD